MAITSPSEYLRLSRQEFNVLPANYADMLFQGIVRLEWKANQLTIAPAVPVKYHERMQKVWIVMALNIVFTNASRKISLAQRHQILQNTLLLCNISER